MHEEPSQLRTSRRGVKLVEGMTICIEPMVIAGGRSVYLDRNGWGAFAAQTGAILHTSNLWLLSVNHAEQLSTFDFIEKDPNIRF